ncbi:MAG: Alginate lyase 2 [Fibrobacteres bacterium]|nr:Alginate lyase 2 [Fibrobacterota bacterium]
MAMRWNSLLIGILSGTALSAGAALDPAKAPGGNFTLSMWTLQLPLASGGSVEQIKGADLMAGYTSTYFSTGTDGSMTFWCPVTGGTTPNSHYPRSELREVWPGGEWKFDGHHVLTAKCRVTKVPDNGLLIFGQIHGNLTGSEIVKLYWNNGAIQAAVEPNRTDEVRLGLGNFSLGDTLNYTLDMTDNKLKATVNGKSVTYDYSAATWKTDTYYFKAGSYVQDNTGASTVGGKVQFYSLAIEHNGVTALLHDTDRKSQPTGGPRALLNSGLKIWVSSLGKGGVSQGEDFLGRGFEIPAAR